jgi:hypothetical protein
VRCLTSNKTQTEKNCTGLFLWLKVKGGLYYLIVIEEVMDFIRDFIHEWGKMRLPK